MGLFGIVGAYAQQGAETSCAMPFPVPPTVVDSSLIVLGEAAHGTREIPAFTAEFACALAEQGRPVTLALEMDYSEQQALDTYLASDGGEAALRTLISGIFWRRESQDGLSSTGTVAMIERVRVLRRSGHEVALLAIDGMDPEMSLPAITDEQEQFLALTAESEERGGAQAAAALRNMLPELAARDAAMAQRLRNARATDPGRRYVVLVGNGHAVRIKGVPFPGVDSMASLLADETLLSLEIEYISGSIWTCEVGRGCGVIDMDRDDRMKPRLDAARQRGQGFHLGYNGTREPAAADPFDGRITLERVSAAQPAYQQPAAD